MLYINIYFGEQAPFIHLIADFDEYDNILS